MRILVITAALLLGQLAFAQVLPDVPDGVQAISLSGKPLMSPAPRQATLDQLATAKADYEADSNNADNIIWYGRRTAYTGDYRGAIEIFSEGLE